MKVIKWWKLSCDKSYLVKKVKEVEIAKEVIRSDGWWRFACGDVLIVYIIYLFSELLGNFMKKWDFKPKLWCNVNGFQLEILGVALFFALFINSWQFLVFPKNFSVMAMAMSSYGTNCVLLLYKILNPNVTLF